jgi:lipid II:glycine glycyltransferase (peptidoglycan interpeptide bridge formation enzyme)
MIEGLTKTEKLNINKLLDANQPELANVLHFEEMANLKKAYGWQPLYFKFKFSKNSPGYTFLVMQKKVPLLGELWYIPKGPNINASEIIKFSADIQEIAKKYGVFIVKLEPEITAEGLISVTDNAKLLHKNKKSIQTNTSTIVVDLSPSEEEIINKFKQKTRYNVRLSERKGVTVNQVEASDDNFDKFYQILEETADRNNLPIKPKAYSYKMWADYIKAGHGSLFFANIDDSDQPLAAAFIMHGGSNALYKDGASSREKSNLMAPYALQWGIIKALKQKGVKSYDLHGSAPSDRSNDQSHPYHKITHFKLGFASNIIDYAGVYDIPVNKLRYKIWMIIEPLYLKIYYKIKKTTFY